MKMACNFINNSKLNYETSSNTDTPIKDVSSPFKENGKLNMANGMEKNGKLFEDFMKIV